MSCMSWFKKNKEERRYYLFPGQGGRSLRRKRRMMFWASITIGGLVSGVLALLIWWFNQRI